MLRLPWSSCKGRCSPTGRRLLIGSRSEEHMSELQSLTRPAALPISNAATTSLDSPDVRDASSPMVQLQGQMQSNRAEIANRERAVADLKAKVIDYQARLNQEPVREQQLSDLTRGYEQSKANYDELLKKKNESAMATSMELLQQGERFRIIDPPSLPVKPEFPNRLKFCGIGLGFG